MIETQSLIYKFEYVYAGIKEELGDNDWNNCLISYNEICKCYKDNKVLISVNKDQEIIEVKANSNVIAYKYSRNLVADTINADYIILYNKDDYKVFGNQNIHDDYDFIAYCISDSISENFCKKYYSLLSGVFIAYFEKFKKEILNFFFEFYLTPVRITFEKEFFKTNQRVDINHFNSENETIIKKKHDFYLTENYLIISYKDETKYYSLDKYSTDILDCFNSKNFNISILNLSLKNLLDRGFYKEEYISKVRINRDKRNIIAHANYKKILLLSQEKLIENCNYFIREIKTMQEIIKEISKIDLAMDIAIAEMDSSTNMTKEEYNNNLDFNSDDKLASFTNNIIREYKENIKYYNVYKRRLKKENYL